MVDRDDLLDGGASQVARTVRALKARQPDLLVETLTGDFTGRQRDVETVLAAAPDVFAHNIEVTRRLTPSIRDARCGYDRSLEVLQYVKDRAPERLTKSSLMVGIGETDDEVLETLADLRNASVDVITIGQYLRPSKKHAPVLRFVEPERFAAFERAGLELGFAFVASGPLVRSSYRAAEGFIAARIGSPGRPRSADTVDDPTGTAGAPVRLLSPSSLVRSSRPGASRPVPR
jgi:lipoic acid synthetase